MAKTMYIALRGEKNYDCETTFVCAPEYFENFIIELEDDLPYKLKSYIEEEGIKLVELIPKKQAKIDIKQLICQFEIEEAKKQEKRKQMIEKQKVNAENVAKKKKENEKEKAIASLLKHNKDDIRAALEAAGFIEKGGVFMT